MGYPYSDNISQPSLSHHKKDDRVKKTLKIVTIVSQVLVLLILTWLSIRKLYHKFKRNDSLNFARLGLFIVIFVSTVLNMIYSCMY